ncbi:MAG: class I SAM-dependent methyltransferase [Gammaproteobacteria bacterium]|nr:class I SAM-dependent methyltransferase [Gammaproteobacteria bacterium]
MTTENASIAVPGVAQAHSQEVASGNRFAFGDNWHRYLKIVDDKRIERAVESLQAMLEVKDLQGKSFLDIGSGSGIFSLAARRLGARVFSFDYDPRAAACTQELKRRYFEHDREWQVQTGSALDREFLGRLGRFDIVYSWGVLHHTGDLWGALANVDRNVAEGGKLFISLANDQGEASRRWTTVKMLYNRMPSHLKGSFAVLVYLPLELRKFVGSLAKGRPQAYFSSIWNYGVNRGMSWWRDNIDWIGGYPFQVSKPEEILDFYRARGYTLLKMTTCGRGHGCNEYVLQRNPQPGNGR